jgi:hypothetical protein
MLPGGQIAAGHDIRCHGVVAKGLLILDNPYMLCGPLSLRWEQPTESVKLVKKKPDLMFLLFLLFGVGVVLSAGASLI